MKEKIKKLFQGTREDMIIACSLLVQYFDPKQFLDEWEAELDPDFLKRIYPNRTDHSRALVIFKEDIHNIFNNPTNIYYKVNDQLYILLDIGQAIAECYINYDYRREIINHQ